MCLKKTIVCELYLYNQRNANIILLTYKSIILLVISSLIRRDYIIRYQTVCLLSF